jgi:hypothetical protein
MGEVQTGDCDGYEENAFNQHWSYYFNSGGIMYGNNIEDLGNGKFKIYNASFKFGMLDQYLMGIRSPDEVGTLFVFDVGDAASSGSASIPLKKGNSETKDGKKIEFTVQDVINSVGKRDPASDPCHWKAALIVVYEKGKIPSASDLLKLAKYGNRWEEFYAQATDNRGSMDLTIGGTGKGTEQCPAPDVPVPDEPVSDTAEPVTAEDTATAEEINYEDAEELHVVPDELESSLNDIVTSDAMEIIEAAADMNLQDSTASPDIKKFDATTKDIFGDAAPDDMDKSGGGCMHGNGSAVFFPILIMFIIFMCGVRRFIAVTLPFCTCLRPRKER